MKPMPPSQDIFSTSNSINRKKPNEFTILSQNLFNSKLGNYNKGYTFETNPQWKIEIFKVPTSVGFIGTRNGIKYISYYGLECKITSNN